MGTGDDDGTRPGFGFGPKLALHSVGPMSHIRPGEARSKKAKRALYRLVASMPKAGCERATAEKIDRTNRLTLLRTRRRSGQSRRQSASHLVKSKAA